MNTIFSFSQLVAESSPSALSGSTQLLLAAFLIVVAGFGGLLIGFALGNRLGKTSERLNALKQLQERNPRRSRSRSRAEIEQELNG